MESFDNIHQRFRRPHSHRYVGVKFGKGAGMFRDIQQNKGTKNQSCMPHRRAFSTDARFLMLTFSFPLAFLRLSGNLRCAMEAQVAETGAPRVFSIPQQWRPHRDLHRDFACLVEDINAVNHGEFETAVDMAIKHADYGDRHGPERPAALVVQRCRRGGKTFMLHHVAAKLTQRVDEKTHVIFLTMNTHSRHLVGKEDACQAILSRIAYEYTGCSDEDSSSYNEFQQLHITVY